MLTIKSSNGGVLKVSKDQKTKTQITWKIEGGRDQKWRILRILKPSQWAKDGN